jgi:hypothetical protein
MKISFIGTYPPNQCGIGVFTNHLVKYVSSGKNDAEKMSLTDVIVINERISKEDYPPEVKYTIQKQDQLDYTKAADFINFSDSRICILQHEFGIFGGDSGVYILPLIHRLRVPLVVTFHTVLKNPSFLEIRPATPYGNGFLLPSGPHLGFRGKMRGTRHAKP